MTLCFYVSIRPPYVSVIFTWMQHRLAAKFVTLRFYVSIRNVTFKYATQRVYVSIRSLYVDVTEVK